jgi:hypothetical protein
VSDATRISPEALAVTLKRVLDHHYDPRRIQWDIDGPAPDLSAPERVPTQLVGFAGWQRNRDGETRSQTCLHCHQVSEILREPAIEAKKFDKQLDTQVWPLPENVGIQLDRDDGLRVTSVMEGSPAAKVGLRAGDSLGAAGGRKLLGQADFRGVLHRGPKRAGTIPVVWLRGGEVMAGDLAVSEGWRKTILDWRMSIAQGNIGEDCGFFPLSIGKEERAALGLDEDAMGVKPYMYKEPTAASRAGLRGSQVIVAVNGQSPNVAGRAFEWWFRQHFDAGDEVRLTVRDGAGPTGEIVYRLEVP